MEVKSLQEGTSFFNCHKGATWASRAVVAGILVEPGILLSVSVNFFKPHTNLERLATLNNHFIGEKTEPPGDEITYLTQQLVEWSLCS